MRLFFASSRAFHEQLTSLYDLVNPTAAAMWNLRWQVRGYIEERDSTDNRELHGRFIAGSGIGSANLRRHCMERTWEEQVGEIALLTLFGAIGLFEGWTFNLEVGSPDQRRRLQFPSRGTDGRLGLGVGDTLSALQAAPSKAIDASYGPVLRANRRCMPTRLDDMLAIYRSFKEIRNACAHQGRMPSPEALTAYSNALPRVSGLGKDGAALRLPSVSTGTPITLSLLNVQTACALLLNIVVTLDAELAVTKAGEEWLVDQWRQQHGFQRTSGYIGNRSRDLRRWSLELGLPRPGAVSSLYDLLKNVGLVL